MTAVASPPGTPARHKRSRPTLIAAVAVGIVIALLVFLLATRKTGERINESKLIGKPAPALNGSVILGEPIDIGSAEGWTLVNFFATWCVPCIQEHPELKAFEKEHREKGDARVVSVVYGDKASAVKTFFQDNGGDWTVLGSDNGRTPFYWGVAKVPESYLVSPTGIVVERFISGVTREQINSVIDLYENQAGG